MLTIPSRQSLLRLPPWPQATAAPPCAFVRRSWAPRLPADAAKRKARRCSPCTLRAPVRAARPRARICLAASPAPAKSAAFGAQLRVCGALVGLDGGDVPPACACAGAVQAAGATGRCAAARAAAAEDAVRRHDDQRGGGSCAGTRRGRGIWSMGLQPGAVSRQASIRGRIARRR
jgi:hypothetical protein